MEDKKQCVTCGAIGPMEFEGERNSEPGKQYYACSDQCRKIFDRFDTQQV